MEPGALWVVRLSARVQCSWELMDGSWCVCVCVSADQSIWCFTHTHTHLTYETVSRCVSSGPHGNSGSGWRHLITFKGAVCNIQHHNIYPPFIPSPLLPGLCSLPVFSFCEQNRVDELPFCPTFHTTVVLCSSELNERRLCVSYRAWHHCRDANGQLVFLSCLQRRVCPVLLGWSIKLC